MSKSLKRKAVNGIVWKIVEQGAKQLIYLAISVILARLIMPNQFGMIAMLTVFIAIANVFIDAGFTQALIRKSDRTQVDCSTVFWFNIFVAIICYVIIYFIAPFISDFYNIGELTPILRVSALSLLFGSTTGVHRSLLGADMNFKALTKFNILGMVVSGILGIVFAYLDFEVWALVIQSLSLTLISSIVIWLKVPWRPSMAFSRQSFKEFFGFGSKLLGSSLLDTVYTNIYSIVIGKVYKASDLAFYNRASALTNLTSGVPTSILQSVTYPTLCKLQDDEGALRNGYRRTICISAFVIFPCCLGIGAVAFPLINVLYTHVWMYAATLLSIIVFSWMWYPIHAINLNYLIVTGRSDLFLRLEIIKKIQGVLILCATIPFGLEAMCWGSVLGSLLCLIWNTYYTGKFLKMGILLQLKDILHIVILSAVMFTGTRIAAELLGNGIISLIISILVGILIYVGGAYLFKFPEIKEIKNLRK